ncbi:MAG: hypothetical protein OXH50_00345, partial [Gemmatimonadetes bacterium]|nr:hypothetical protein [Gemmatimonadota bacterium]
MIYPAGAHGVFTYLCILRFIISIWYYCAFFLALFFSASALKNAVTHPGTENDMLGFILLACSTFIFLTSAVSAQQEVPAPNTESPAPTLQAVEPPTAPAACLVGEHSGFPEADARTAALLVCGELNKQGISVGEPVFRSRGAGGIYRLGLHRLGKKILVRLSHEYPAGTVVVERQIQLGNIEEMISAAPRLVDALVNRKSLASTLDMETVVEQEALRPRKIPGESFWDIGLLGTFALITDADMIGKPGYRLGWFHETPSYAVGTAFWGAGGEDDEGDSFHFFSWGIGGRYFFNKQNFSPYVGGGFSHVWSGYEQTASRWNSRRDRWEDEWES